ncbi:MAG: HD domain-containing protein [Candidatus Coatesbacteria bacterium]|nr:MAG: HD domain-containing protein [Candidatus Coatesbacteria bacterium]
MPKELKLALAERTEDGISVFKFSGTLGVEGATGVAGLFQACLQEKVFKIVVDLKDVSFISSAGIGAFLSVVGELRSRGGDIIFVKMSDKIARVFESLDVLDFFTDALDISSAKVKLRAIPTAETVTEEPEKGPIELLPRADRQRNVFRNLLSLLAAYSDILGGRGKLSEKLARVLGITASYLSLAELAIVSLTGDYDLPEVNIAGGPPPATNIVRKQLADALRGKPPEIPGNVRGLSRESKSWLRDADVHLVFPLTYRDEVVSALMVGPKKSGTEVLPEERRILRYLHGSINLLYENVKLKETSTEIENTEELRADRVKLHKKLIETETLYMVSKELASNVDIRKVFPVLLVILVGQMGTDKAVLLIRNESGTFEVAGVRGISEARTEGFTIRVDKGIAAELAGKKEPISIDVLSMLGEPEDKKSVEAMTEIGISLIAPVIFKDKLIGVVGLGPKVSSTFYSDDELRLLGALLNLAGISIENARLFSKITETYTDVVRAMVSAIEARDKYTRGHTERVTRYANAFGRGLGLNADEMQTLMLGAVLHDVGYLGVSETAITEPDGLTDELRAEIQKHTIVGYQILKEIKFLEKSLDIVKHHHEWWDGTGYPDGLAAEEIPFGARVVSLCDSLDAMTSDRRYRGAKEMDEVVNEIKSNSGTQFDPVLAGTFVNMLSDGTISIIERK